MARRFHRSGSTRPKRETLWIALGFLIDTTDASSIIISSLNAAALALRPFTVVRTHISYEFGSDQNAASEVQSGAIAMAVVSDQASAIGVTAVPTPTTDIGSDLFFVHEIMFNTLVVSDATGKNFRTSQTGKVDSKAMRRVVEGEDIVFVFESSALSSGATITTAGRMLVKLH